MHTRISGFSIITKILASMAGFFLFVTFGAVIGPFLRPIFLGWLTYPALVLPRAHPSGMITCWTAICLITLIGGSHPFLRWLYRYLHESAWRLRWSLSITTLVFLLLLSGMSMMGIAHQTGWLITSPMRLTERRRDWNCRSNMRQIGVAILLYNSDSGGHYPPDLSTLLLNQPLSPYTFICPSSDDQPGSDTATTQQSARDLTQPHHCSYFYLGKGLIDPIPPTQVLLVEPPQNHAGDGMNVLYGDGHAEWVDREKAAEIFVEYHLPDDSTAQELTTGKSK